MKRDGSNSVRAVVRVRPLLSHEVERGYEACCEVADSHSLLIHNPALNTQWRQYAFDACLPMDRSQKQVFQECGVSSLLDASLMGYSSTVLAYGQTGSGKTYTMMGRIGTGQSEDEKREDGLVTRSAKSLFRRICSSQPLPAARYSVSVSFTEIYNAPGAVNECICDLLNPSASNLQVRQNKRHGFFVSDLSVVDCQSAADVRSVLEAGLQNRRVAAHALNKDSSRSHALFTLYVDAEDIAETSVENDVGGVAKRYGKITFVDLAGSERLKESAAEGHTRKETQAINKSLFTLGQVISQLASGKAQQHVPYRNSKLTQLLQESFGGEALCLMVTCISPAASFAEESLNSLKYATKAMNIENRPVVRMDERQRLVAELRSENSALKKELGCYHVKFGELSAEELQEMGHINFITRDLRRSESDKELIQDHVAEHGSRSGTPTRPSSRGAKSPRRTSTPNSARLEELQARRARREATTEGEPIKQERSRGQSEPPPPPLPPQPPLAPGSISKESSGNVSVGSYAMAAAKRRMMSEQQQNRPPRKRMSQKNELPPIPRRPCSGSSAGSHAVASTESVESPELKNGSSASQRTAKAMKSFVPASGSDFDEDVLADFRRASGFPGARSNDTSEGMQRSPSVDHLSDDTRTSTRPSLSTPCGSSASSQPVVRTLKAPPSTKAVASKAKDPRGHARSTKDIMPEITQQQIERLDSAAWSEWQFDFGGPLAPVSKGYGGSSNSESPKHQKRSGYIDAPVRSIDTQPQSRCSTRGSQSDSFSSPSRRSTSPTDSLTGHRDVAPTGSPLSGSKENNATKFESADQQYSCQRMSLAELNSQLSSMHTATSALL